MFKTSNEYDDDNIPEIDTPITIEEPAPTDAIPDERPRTDGPGGN